MADKGALCTVADLDTSFVAIDAVLSIVDLDDLTISADADIFATVTLGFLVEIFFILKPCMFSGMAAVGEDMPI